MLQLLEGVVVSPVGGPARKSWIIIDILKSEVQNDLIATTWLVLLKPSRGSRSFGGEEGVEVWRAAVAWRYG